MSDQLRGNALVNDALGSALRNGGSALETAPALLKRVLAEQSWREFVTKRDEHVQHERFADFVTARPLRGLGSDLALVRRIVADDKETLDLLDQALQGRQGQRTDLVNNINEVRPQGTSQTQALRRLRTEAGRGNQQAAELHAEVLAGSLSAHAAMVTAGFRPKTISVPVGRPERVAAYLRKHMPREALTRLVELLTKEDSE
jgi:hypothetical protein